MKELLNNNVNRVVLILLVGLATTSLFGSFVAHAISLQVDWAAWADGSLQNFSTEMLGALATFVLIEVFVGGQKAKQESERREAEVVNRRKEAERENERRKAQEMRESAQRKLERQLNAISRLRLADSPEACQPILDEMQALDLLNSIELANVELGSVTLIGANLQGAQLARSKLQGANLSTSNLEKADLSEANLQHAQLEKTNLYRTKLTNSNLQNADLFGANLENANLFDSNLIKANLWRANLQGAGLFGASLQGANLQQANLRGVFLAAKSPYGDSLEPVFDENTILPDGSYYDINRGIEQLTRFGAIVEALTLDDIEAQRKRSD